MHNKLPAAALALLLSVSLSVRASCHPGGTDQYGGHWDRSTGEYHYHHGYPAHQHPNGICPYNNRDNTDHRSGSSSSSGSSFRVHIPPATQPSSSVSSASPSDSFDFLSLLLLPGLLGIGFILTKLRDLFDRFINN